MRILVPHFKAFLHPLLLFRLSATVDWTIRARTTDQGSQPDPCITIVSAHTVIFQVCEVLFLNVGRGVKDVIWPFDFVPVTGGPCACLLVQCWVFISSPPEKKHSNYKKRTEYTSSVSHLLASFLVQRWCTCDLYWRVSRIPRKACLLSWANIDREHLQK